MKGAAPLHAFLFSSYSAAEFLRKDTRRLLRCGAAHGIFGWMENPLPFLPMNPLDRTQGLQAINLKRVDGTSLSLDPAAFRLNFTEEHPNVERMADDWGAICEVYKNSAELYLSIPNVPLQAGDMITLVYRDKPARSLRVTELEAGRARIVWLEFPND
jgi:hypothetical protein